MAITQCNSLEQLETCIRNPSSFVPTFEFRVRSFDLPLDAQDVAYLGTTIKPFADEVSVINNGGTVNRSMNSKNFEQPEYQLPANFIALGICVLAYVEPYGMGIDGNLLTTQANVLAMTKQPYSPDNYYEGFDATLVNNAGVASVCPTILDWGSPTWTFSDWFFKTYRMSVQCQVQSNVHEVLNERLIDMGNCCVDTSKEGFSNANGDWLDACTMTNSRLRAIQLAGLQPDLSAVGLPAMADMGFFQPLNAKATYDVRQGVVANQMTADGLRLPPQPVAFGGVQAAGQHKWYKFDVPRFIRAHRNIKIQMERLPEDLPNWVRMVRSAGMSMNSGVIPTGGGAAKIGDIVVGDASYTAYLKTLRGKLPGGRVSIGIGLKGLLVDDSMCTNDFEQFINGLSAGEAADAFNWTGGPATSNAAVVDAGKAIFGSKGGCGSCGT